MLYYIQVIFKNVFLFIQVVFQNIRKVFIFFLSVLHIFYLRMGYATMK